MRSRRGGHPCSCRWHTAEFGAILSRRNRGLSPFYFGFETSLKVSAIIWELQTTKG
jgi:hypothetical protein